MNQQQYRLLCMDIDGTLLNSAHELPPASREAVRSAAKNGVTICLMSARPPRAVFPIRDALGVDGPLACCGGGLILQGLQGDNRLADSRLSCACAQTVLRETKARSIHLSVYRDLDWLIAAEDEWSRAEAQITGVQPAVAPLETLFADWGGAGAHKQYQGTKRRNTLCIPSICNADICKLYQVFNARFDRCKRRI